MSQWQAIVEEKTGRLISTGTVIADVLPVGVIAVPIPQEPQSDEVWNERLLCFIHRPAKDLVDRLKDLCDRPDVAAALQNLKEPHRQTILDIFVWLLGNRRYRAERPTDTNV